MRRVYLVEESGANLVELVGVVKESGANSVELVGTAEESITEYTHSSFDTFYKRYSLWNIDNPFL
ncbi:hypothetical protein CEW92_13195 [Bacillaceae bacterium SAS-127]|nr:hypothetical protein CEW92_13195 [Bacillaceae bacterium SAS-127]